MPLNRNLSLLKSKILSEEKMTEINGVLIPYLAGTSNHAILCALAEYRDRIIFWERLFQLSEKYLRQFGGPDVCDEFLKIKKVNDYKKRIKDTVLRWTANNTKTNLGYRLHERGMVVYVFSDGAMLITGGKLVKDGKKY